MFRYFPEKVDRDWKAPVHSGRPESFDSDGAAASLGCGVTVRFFVSVDRTGSLASVRFVTDGCGWAVAAAEILARAFGGRQLTELHALEDLEGVLESHLGEIPGVRVECVKLAGDAFSRALAAYRDKKVSEWKGEQALICSCFGVSEETIESLARSGVSSIEGIGENCRAGTGCGSCQMLIQEIIGTKEV